MWPGSESMNRVFHKIIEPSIESVPVLEVTHTERHNGREYILKQIIRRNVYTEFDAKLSRHLAATGRQGFPAFTVAVRVVESASGGKEHRLESSFHDSVPHALYDLSERALSRAGPVDLTFRRCSPKKESKTSISHTRKITERDIESLRTALDICREIGDTDFLDVSGDFGIIVVIPPAGFNHVIIQLTDGTISVPSSLNGDDAPFKWPLYSFVDHATTNAAAKSYLAMVGQAIVSEKESAILTFRSAAEQRIVDFNNVLAGRRLEGHWLEAASGLVARLKAGLGDTLNGLSEAPRGIGMDLAAMVDEIQGAPGAIPADPPAKPDVVRTNAAQ